MSLKDNRLLEVLKVQLQIVGVDQDPQSLGSMLHYQMAYQIQIMPLIWFSLQLQTP